MTAPARRWLAGTRVDQLAEEQIEERQVEVEGRWRNDARGAAVDLAGDGNRFSFYFRSPLDIARKGRGRAVCDDLRAGCPEMRPDGGPPDYDFVTDAGGRVIP